MTVLSNVDIEYEIVSNDIRIFPLNISNIKSSTYNLTASKYAWSLLKEKSIYNSSNNEIEIPPHDTGLIATNEVIWVSKRICGTYHSKVTNVSEGGGHISTTLDSTWLGHSIIAVHNHTDRTIRIGADKTFVSIMFHYLKTPTTKQQGNQYNQTNKIPFALTTAEKDYFDINWKNDSDELLRKMKFEKDYIILLEAVKEEEDLVKKAKDAATKKIEKKKAKRNKIIVSILSVLLIIIATWQQTIGDVGTIEYVVSNFVLFACFSGIAVPIYTKIFSK